MPQYELISPNLPNKKVKALIINKEINRKALSKLKELDIEPFLLSSNESLNPYLINHPDLNINHLSYKKIITNNENIIQYVTKNTNAEIIKPMTEISDLYPSDCRLNCVILNDLLIYNDKSTDSSIVAFGYNNSMKMIKVKQGYIKCSVCIVDDYTIITDDESIYNSTKNHLKDSLLISKGSVKLNGYNYGFIGGTSGKISKNQLVFNGDVKLHSDSKKIIDFLDKHNIEAISLADYQLTDIGSLIPIY